MAYTRSYKTSKGQLRWRSEVRVKGSKPVSKSFIRKTDAERWARSEVEKRQRQSVGIQETQNCTLGEAIKRYQEEHLPKLKDQVTITSMLNWWQVELGERLLHTITAHDVVRLRQKLADQPYVRGKAATSTPKLRSARTVQGYVNCLSNLFSIAIKDWGWVSQNPVEQVKKLKINNERTRYLSDYTHLWPNEAEPPHWDDLSKDEKIEAGKKFPRAYELPRLTKALLAQAEKGSSFHTDQMWAYYLFTIQLSAGLRLAEATHMVWEENEVVQHPIVIADMANKQLILKSTKHDTKPRIKPICGAMLDVLKELYAGRRYDTPLVFPRDDGKKPLDFRRRINKAIADAKLQDFRWHDLRHTTASYLSMMGAMQREIMEALHHRNLQSSQRYTHLSNTHMRGLMDKFSEKIFESSQNPSRF